MFVYEVQVGTLTHNGNFSPIVRLLVNSKKSQQATKDFYVNKYEGFCVRVTKCKIINLDDQITRELISEHKQLVSERPATALKNYTPAITNNKYWEHGKSPAEIVSERRKVDGNTQTTANHEK